MEGCDFDSFDHAIDDWIGDGVEVIRVEKFTRLALDGDLTAAGGCGYPVKSDKFNFDYPILPEFLDAVPLDATHIIWFDR